MSKNPSPKRRGPTVPEILQAIQSLPGPERVALFTTLSEHPGDTTPFVVLFADLYHELLGDILSAQLNRLGRGRPRAKSEEHATMYNMYIADPKEHNQKKLARKFHMKYATVRQIIRRERLRRANLGAEPQGTERLGQVNVTWEK